MRVVNGVHSDTSHDGAAAEPPAMTGLPELLGAVTGVRDGSDGSATPGIDELLDAGGEADENTAGGGGLFEDLGSGAGGADEFGAFSGAEFDVVD